MTILETAEAIFPEATREEYESIVWCETGFPFFGRVLIVMQLLKARAAREQAARNRK